MPREFKERREIAGQEAKDLHRAPGLLFVLPPLGFDLSLAYYQQVSADFMRVFTSVKDPVKWKIGNALVITESAGSALNSAQLSPFLHQRGSLLK